MNRIIRLFKKEVSPKLKVILDTCVFIDYFDGSGEIEYIQDIFIMLDQKLP